MLTAMRAGWLGLIAGLLAAVWSAGAAESAAPKLYLIGGSTLATFPPERPVVGWGQMLPQFFRDPAIVQNRAKSGRSSKSFIDGGFWAGVIAELKAGDYLLVQFGTNDAKKEDATRYTEPRGAYRINLLRFIREARAKGAIPLLATSVARRQWDAQGNFVEPPSEWVVVTREVAAEANVPLLEMRHRTIELAKRLGPQGSVALHLYLPDNVYAAYPKGAKDDTHYCQYGASRVAELGAGEIRRLGLPLAAWLREPVPVPPGKMSAVGLPSQGLCAHRGVNATFPENTLPALIAAVRLGAPMIEFDLALTRDGELVLMHDTTVNRTTNGRGKVLDLDLAEIRKLDAGTWKDARFAGTRVPTFAEALAVLPRHVWLNIDLKADARWGPHTADIGRRVAEIILADGRQHQALLAARADTAAMARRTAPGILICNMDRKPDPAAYVADAIAQRADFIQLRDCATDPRFPTWITALKAAGVRTNYFYANDPLEVTRLFAAGVDFVLVDDLEKVTAALKPRGAP